MPQLRHDAVPVPDVGHGDELSRVELPTAGHFVHAGQRLHSQAMSRDKWPLDKRHVPDELPAAPDVTRDLLLPTVQRQHGFKAAVDRSGLGR